MLQVDKTSSVLEREPNASDARASEQIFDTALDFLRRQYPIILFVMACTVAVGAVYALTTPPRFTAQATMIIDNRKVQLFQQPSMIGDMMLDAANIDSQTEILKSENVALSVIKDLHLTEDPEFTAPGGGLIGTLFGFASNVFSLFSSDPPSEFALTRSAMGVFKSRLGVRRIGMTYVIEISFQSNNPDRAAQIANAVADAYIVDQLDAKYQATRRASVWLQDRIKELRDQASAAERAVVEFKAKNNIVDAGGRLMNDQQLAELNSQRVIARTQLSEAQARLDRINSVLRSDSVDATVSGTVTDTLNSPVVTKLRSQYLELASREADWSVRYGPNHLAVVNLRNQMREIRASIADELRRLAETYKSDYEIAKQRDENIQKDLAQAVSESQLTSQAQVTQRELESSAQTYRALYDNFLQRYMESVQQQSFPVTEARVITQATRPGKASHPNIPLILAAALFGGAALGIGLATVRELWDRVFRTGDQVERMLHTGCIALVPMVEIDSESLSEDPLSDAESGADSGDRIITHSRQNPVWTVLDSPFSRFAESIRSIKLAVDLNGVVKSSKVVGFTSSVPDEGKSTISTALAELSAQTGARVLLIDADLRNPSLTRRLAPNAECGLIEVLAGQKSLDEVIWKDPATQLEFLPAVFASRLMHSNEVLASDATVRLFEKLRAHYDYIILDLSPLAPIVDVRATTHLVDSYVFVVQWGRTRIDVVKHALNGAIGVYEKLLGVVLSKTDIKTLGRYEVYHGLYRYNKNYDRYGYGE